ncbi:hypothetical protein [Actinoplanes sp. NPDC051859]|uniref:hypothetical protein n=1 Tax=Actinoplanes sp. NPDC051859 TaxID=3363909 RepID=UPI003799AC83
MAAGGPSPKSIAFVGVVTLIVLATTGVWNPFPRLWTWITQTDPIAADAASWQTAIGGSPQTVTITGGTVVIEYRTSIEAYGLTGGVPLWKSDADWAGVVGTGPDAVVVTGRMLTAGYEVLDPATGQVRRKDPAAKAVWTYSDALLDLRCPRSNECELRAWDPRGTEPRWQVAAPGIGFVLDASNPDLPDTQPLGAAGVDRRAGGPGVLPHLIGLPGDGKVQIIDTAQGRVAQTRTADHNQRIAVAGSRVLTVTGESRDGTCYYDVIAHASDAGRPVWQREGLNLRTAGDGNACEQDRDPAGGSNVLLGVGPTGREELISAHDGRDLWRGDKGQRVFAVDNSYALIRSADGKTLSSWSFSRGEVAWRRAAGPEASAALTPYAAIVVEQKPARIVALSPRTGKVLTEARTDAKVFAAGPEGLILVSGRDMAYLPYGSSPAR